jgi:hypothetical protein
MKEERCVCEREKGCGLRYLSNVRGLLLDGDEHVASLVVETLAGVVEADVLDGIADNLLVVKVGLGGDLSEDHDHTSLAGSLASDLGIGILSEARIKHRVRHNVAELVCGDSTHHVSTGWAPRGQNFGSLHASALHKKIQTDFV